MTLNRVCALAQQNAMANNGYGVEGTNRTRNSNTVISIPSENLFVPQALGRVSVEYNGREFSVVDSNSVKVAVARMDLSPELRGISIEGLKKVLSAGYLAISKIGENYAIRFNGRLLGGGPILALVTYVGANVVGGAMVIVGAVTAPVGGGALIAGGVALVTIAPYTLVATLPAPTP